MVVKKNIFTMVLRTPSVGGPAPIGSVFAAVVVVELVALHRAHSGLLWCCDELRRAGQNELRRAASELRRARAGAELLGVCAAAAVTLAAADPLRHGME